MSQVKAQARDRSRAVFLLLWGALLLLKLAVAARLPLFGDEAFYWWESTAPDWAYAEIPAGTPWLIWLGTLLGGDTLLGVRWPFLLMGAAMPWLVWRIARRWFGDGVAWRAGILSLALPLLATMGTLALPDVPLTFATLVCLDAGAMLLRRASARAFAWLAFGLVLGALAHYRFPAVIAAGFVGLMLEPRGRALLRTPGLWLALLAGALAWVPLLWWNLEHANAGLNFQLVDRHPWRPQIKGALLPLAQFVFVTPLLLVLLLGTLVHAWRRWRAGDGGAPWGYVLGTAVVPLLGLAVLGVFADTERISFHWMLPGYLPLLAVAPVLLARWKAPWRVALYALAAAGVLLSAGYLLMATSPTLRERAVAGSLPYPSNFAGWDEIGAHVRERLRDMPPDTRVVADNFMLAAHLAFALEQHPVGVLDHPLNHKHGRAVQLEVWDALTTPRDPRRPTLLVLGEDATPPRDALAWYRHVCTLAGGLPPTEVLSVDRGRKRFLLFPLAAGGGGKVSAQTCALPALLDVYTPRDGERVPPTFELRGWAFKDGAGIARIEVLLDGDVVGTAHYGLEAAHVGEFWRISEDPAHPHVDFAHTLHLPPGIRGWHWLGLRVHGRDGSVEDHRQWRIQVEE